METIQNLLWVVAITTILLLSSSFQTTDKLYIQDLENTIQSQRDSINYYLSMTDSLSNEGLRYDPETVWLARGIYSETNDLTEMILVGKVIRNRYEMQYNGNDTYKDIILDPWQFSGFNNNNSRRYHNITRSITSPGTTWRAALNVAYLIRTQEWDTTFNATHFYSSISMVPRGSAPRWAEQLEPVGVQDVDPERFRFFTNQIGTQ